MPAEDYRPKFVFEVTEEQKARADRLLGQYGMHKALFSPILDDVLDLIEDFGGVVIGAILSGQVKPREVIPTLASAETLGKKVKSV